MDAISRLWTAFALLPLLLTPVGVVLAQPEGGRAHAADGGVTLVVECGKCGEVVIAPAAGWLRDEPLASARGPARALAPAAVPPASRAGLTDTSARAPATAQAKPTGRPSPTERRRREKAASTWSDIAAGVDLVIGTILTVFPVVQDTAPTRVVDNAPNAAAADRDGGARPGGDRTGAANADTPQRRAHPSDAAGSRTR